MGRDRIGPAADRLPGGRLDAARRSVSTDASIVSAVFLVGLAIAGSLRACRGGGGDGYGADAAATAVALGAGGIAVAGGTGAGGAQAAGESTGPASPPPDRSTAPGAAPGAAPVDPADRAALRAAYGVAPLDALRVAYPPNNAPTAARAALGRLLFFDPILSGEEDVSCAVCHQPARAFGDGRARSAGAGGGAALGPARAAGVSRLTGRPFAESARNAPTVLNVGFLGRGAGIAYGSARAEERPTSTYPSRGSPDAPPAAYDDFLSILFWDGRSDKGLEGQALHPLGARDEMAGDAYPFRDAHWTVLARLRAIPEYDRLFRAAFPDLAEEETAITSSSLARAIAAFERTLVTPDAPFDRWLAGDDGALDGAALRGKALFFGPAGCAACHNGPMFTDLGYHVVGAAQAGPGLPDARGDDIGRGAVTHDDADRYAFRTPPLRNIALTAPYFHAGTADTLRDAVAFFARGGNDRGLQGDRIDPWLRPLDLSAGDVDDLVAFLGSLTGTVPVIDVPARVPSGLKPVVGRAGDGIADVDVDADADADADLDANAAAGSP